MIAHSFALHVPASLDEAVRIAAHYEGEACVLGGGTVLLPDLSRGYTRPRAVIDLTRAGLGGVYPVSGGIRMGATATYRDLERSPYLNESLQLLARMAHAVTGGAQIRNRATVGGSAVQANPASDLPAVLVAMGARLRLARVQGSRDLPAESFFLGSFRTALNRTEILASIFVPKSPGVRQLGYYKLKFGESSWPIATAAALVLDNDRVRIVLGGVTETPVVVECHASGPAIEEAVKIGVTKPWSDMLAGADYRGEVAPVVARRAFESAVPVASRASGS
jgi:aerobic carbon-monoxide dehydrogenase medium subunit